MRRGRLDLRLRFGGAAAMMALAGCGDSAQQTSKAAPNSGVTIELPEPVLNDATAPPSAEQAEAVEPKPPLSDAPTRAVASGKAETRDLAENKKPLAAPEPQPAPPPEASRAAEDATPASTTSRPPLPNAVIARTLERIGFRCGSVTSTARIEGSDDPSAYEVTCTSGQKYRASARTGRYRFSKSIGNE